MAEVRGSGSHQSGSCHLTNDQSPTSHQEIEGVCVLEAVEYVVSWQVSGGRRVVWLQLSGSSGSSDH